MGTYFEATHGAALAVRQEHEAAGYIVSVVRKQGQMDAGVSWLSSFCSVRAPSPANHVVHTQDGFSLQEVPPPMYSEVRL